jgi:hypothetical protein
MCDLNERASWLKQIRDSWCDAVGSVRCLQMLYYVCDVDESSGLDTNLAGVCCKQWGSSCQRLINSLELEQPASYRFILNVVCQYRLCTDDDLILKSDGWHEVPNAVSHNSVRAVHVALHIDLTIFVGLELRSGVVCFMTPYGVVLGYSVTRKCRLQHGTCRRFPWLR